MSDISNVPIEPSVITEVKTITSFKLTTQDLQLFTSVTFRVELLNSQGGLIDLKYVVVGGEDYKNWNNDDNYIINKVAEKLGFIVKPSDPAPSDPAPSDPAPSDPAPSDPAPSDPAPSDPAPSEPSA